MFRRESADIPPRTGDLQGFGVLYHRLRAQEVTPADAGPRHNPSQIQHHKARRQSVATFTPLGERIVIKPMEQEAQTRGGILLPDTAKEKPQEGEVVAVGPGRVADDGSRISMELTVGDKVIYSKYAGTEYEDGDEEYLIMRESDVLAKIG
ncbi:MAG: co-chaperone GroES [Chloroflexi bacterium]|nr:co-chaperone GroES [Chloroflexota bacterium]MYD48476.1 co-chaperone GroES [Chloroflexota bacterium]